MSDEWTDFFLRFVFLCVDFLGFACKIKQGEMLS